MSYLQFTELALRAQGPRAHKSRHPRTTPQRPLHHQKLKTSSATRNESHTSVSGSLLHNWTRDHVVSTMRSTPHTLTANPFFPTVPSIKSICSCVSSIPTYARQLKMPMSPPHVSWPGRCIVKMCSRGLHQASVIESPEAPERIDLPAIWVWNM